MFKNFFYSKMVLDVTAIKNYENILNYKTLAEGQSVNFDLIKTDKGFQARNVQSVPSMVK